MASPSGNRCKRAGGCATESSFRGLLRALPNVGDARFELRNNGYEQKARLVMETLSTHPTVSPIGAAVEQFGRIKSANATRMMLWLATKSKTKAEALAWLKRYEASYAPFLAEISDGSPEDAKTVNALLKKLKKL